MSILEIRDQVANMCGVITVVVNDGTRPSPAGYLSALQPVLAGRARFLFATGTHRQATSEERLAILGRDFAGDVVAESNICDDGTHVHIGTTLRGTEVEIHPWLLEGPVLAVNTVEPHYFAGFTGGRKSFLPGSSSRKTIVQNHFLACLPGALQGKLSGNPVHEDMMEGAALLAERTEIVMVNGVFGSDAVFCGAYDASFFKAADVAASKCGISVGTKYRSLELRPGRSLEISLYQAMKAVFLWERAVEDGGELILSADCPEGLGAIQMERLLLASSTALAVPRSAEEYLFGDHAVIRLKRIRSRLSLSFRIGIDMRKFGFEAPPDRCETEIENAGFSFPVMKKEHA
ncbi:MAG: lactate racemase domain-containing protein [Candidatus Sabulitectum sp.]|nr:lactate racemase domain-containing protein [Candidatus Sabulitectum sp.]